jgi:hypothetical protein
MERHGRIPALQALCAEAKKPYTEPDSLWECYEEDRAKEFLNDLVGFPEAGSELAKKKTGARGELMLLGGLTYVLRDTDTYIILSRFLPTTGISEKGSRQPDIILLTPMGIGTLESKMWYGAPDADLKKWAARDRRQITESMTSIDSIVKGRLKKEPAGVVPIVYNPTNVLRSNMFLPYDKRTIHVVRNVADIESAITRDGAKYDEGELRDLRDILIKLPTVAPPRYEQYTDFELCYDTSGGENFPTMEEIEAAGAFMTPQEMEDALRAEEERLRKDAEWERH